MKNKTDRKLFSSKFVLVLILVLLLLNVGLALTLWKAQLFDVQPQVAAPQHAAVQASKPPAAAPALDFDSEAAKLVGAPRSYTPAIAKSLAVRDAIDRGDFVAAENAIGENIRQSRIENWHFSPFNSFFSRIPKQGDEAYFKRLNEWIGSDKKSAVSYLLRAQYHNDTAWDIRGENFASEVQDERMRAFQAHIKQATADIVESMRLDESNPYSWYLWINILAAHGNSSELEAAFQHAIRKFPNYYPLYQEHLYKLAPKWGGSPQEMIAFVDRYAGKADARSPLKLLYLELYEELLDTAWIACRSTESGDAVSPCISRLMSQFVTPELEKIVYTALNLYNYVDKYQFTIEVGDILERMIKKPGAERYAGAILQLAADSMGSDNQLAATDTSKNNYMMDLLTGIVWYRQGHDENAEKMFKRAIADIPNTAFPDEETKDKTVAELYDRLANVYDQTGQFEKTIVYEKAADILGGKARSGWSHLQCHALFKLKHYDNAIKECTAQIEGGGDEMNHYWRAKAYEESGRIEAALQDYRLVADSNHSFRGKAAIEISVVYAKNNDLVHMLETLNSYDYLYDENQQSRKNLAVVYNNRCYAKMQLGDLQGALDDCTASLRYDSMPDAYQKQQELVKRLKAKQAGV